MRPARGVDHSAVLIVPNVSKDGSSTFNLHAKSSLLVKGKLYLYIQ